MAHKTALDIIGADAKTEYALSDLAIVPFGSIEYHGPHAPIGTDSLIAQELGARVAQRAKAVLFPLIAFTNCPKFTSTDELIITEQYPGTINIDADVMTSYIECIFRGLFCQGFKGIFALNAHDGNIKTIRRASERIYCDFQDRFIITINWWETVPTPLVESLSLFSNNGGHGHGGPLETSAAWASQTPPGTVDCSKASDIDTSFGPKPTLSVLNYGNKNPDWRGYHGRVSESSPEKGEKLLQLATDEIVRLLKDWLKDTE